MTRSLLALVFTLAACGDDSPSVTMLENGAACEADNEKEVCTSGTCLAEFSNGTEVAGGLCTDECIWNEDHSDTCAEGEMCLQYSATGEKYCFQDCADTSDCRVEDGWTCACIDFFCSQKACIPPL